jgi:type IV secretion system protein VirD4
VIDPKGDVYKAVKRHREGQGRTVRCIDPLNIAGGTDRWNPLSRIEPTDILYLQSMAYALLPPAESAESAYFQSRANDVLVAAILATIRNGRPDPVGAATLLMDQAGILKALEGCTDQVSMATKDLLTMEPRSRESIISTAQQATQWLRDERMQKVVQNHTFEMIDLAGGKVDLFIVLPADPIRKKVLAPYVRWLLADLFESVRQNKPAERIVAFLDEAYVLGRFDAILQGAGELPGYGVSLWTFWQTRKQMIDVYNASGADTFIGTAEMINVFNLTAALPEEKEYWSQAIGTYTRPKITSATDSKTGRINESRTPEAVRLVAATDLPSFLRKRQVVFLTSPAHTPDPLNLGRTLAATDPRFEGLIDLTRPVGRTM